MTVSEPMLVALEHAWEAFCHGSFPVGAVLVDRSGAMVATGRNRMGEASAPEGRMRSTSLAHAEMDVMAQLPFGDYSGHTLYTSLEPCLLCRAAATMTHIGTVEYLAADSLCDGLDGLPTLNDHAARQYPAMRGPASGPEADFASILPMAVLLAFTATGDTVSHYSQHSPRAFAAASVVASTNAWPARTLDLAAAIDHVAAIVASSGRPA